MNSDYQSTIRMLSTMDEKQLTELWHDMRDHCTLAHIENIGESAIGYIEMHGDEDFHTIRKAE